MTRPADLVAAVVHRIVCRVLGHRFEWMSPIYDGAWVCDERCSRCDALGRWWPS